MELFDDLPEPSQSEGAGPGQRGRGGVRGGARSNGDSTGGRGQGLCDSPEEDL